MSHDVWIIEPRDPFIARDGKPFGVGISAATLSFPFPSTTTGGVRTRAGQASGRFLNADGSPNSRLIAEVKRIATTGVLLVELNEQGEIEKWLVSAPADALMLESKKNKAKIKRLLPLDIGNGITNLDQDPHENESLALVGLSEFDPSKRFDKSPSFWFWEHFEKWLVEPDNLPVAVNSKYLGHNGAIVQTRTHVALDADTWTAREGQLFQTRGLEFTRCEDRNLNGSRRLAMAVPVRHHVLANSIQEGLAPLGGERRSVVWHLSKAQLPDDCLNKIKAKVAIDRACRVVLLTAAWFEKGSQPSWLLSKQHDVTPELVGIANPRTQVISGWDFALVGPNHRGGLPKPTRRLMPAGSVLFLKLQGKADLDVEKWVENIWMSCVSDDSRDGDPSQHRWDGFGLAAIGVWDGKRRPMRFSTGDEG